MRQSQRDKRTYLIIGLCAVLVVMVVGFAAFSSQLTINGTSEISSNWDVHIKDGGVSYKNAVDATSTTAEKTSNLVATFACNLITPGKSTISYDVVVENKGTLNAKLDSINLTGGNSAIAVVTSPTNASLSTSPIVLAPNDETTITVTVSYNDINTQPTGSGLTTNITAQLNFSQTNDSPTPVTPASNTVYAYHTDYKTIGSDVITDGVSDYTQLSSWSSGKTWFLKYELDGNNVIQKAWACQKFSFINEPVCLQGGNASYYAANRGILENLEPIFNAQGGSCYSYYNDDTNYMCSHDNIEIYAGNFCYDRDDDAKCYDNDYQANSGYEILTSNNSCHVSEFEYAYCY